MANLLRAGISGQRFARTLAAMAASALLLSGCSAFIAEPTPTTTLAEPTIPSTADAAADAQWDTVIREFPDATRPDAEFIEWSSIDPSIGTDRLIECLNEFSSSAPEVAAVGHYVCFVQFPEKNVYPTQEEN